MSIRLRLTILYGALVGLTLVAFSVALYFTVARVSVEVLQRTLAGEAGPVLRAPDFRPDRQPFPPRPPAAPATYVQTRGLDGRVQSQSGNLNGFELPISAAALEAVKAGQTRSEVVDGDGGRLL